MLATNNLVKTSSLSLLFFQLLFSPLAAWASTIPSTAPDVRNPIETKSTVGSAPSEPPKFVDDFGLNATTRKNTEAEDSSASSTSPAEASTDQHVEDNQSDSNYDGDPDYDPNKPLLKSDTPILDSAVNGELLAQGDSTTDTPLLREGIAMSADEVEQKIDDLTRQILLKEIELERFGIHYNQEVAKQGRWKGWRYGAFQELNSALGLTGGIISVHNRGRRLKEPLKVKRVVQESANIIPMVGSIIGASAAGMEFGINEFHMFQANRKGYSAKKSRARVLALKNEIDSMLEKRSQMLATEKTMSALSGRVELDEAEDDVLRDMRDQNLQQFERFHIGKRKLFAFQQMQLGFDVFKNTTNALGCYLAFESLHKRQRIYNGYAGVLFAVSGGLTMVAPVVSRYYGKIVSEHHRNLLKPATDTAENATIERLKSHHAALDRAVQNTKLAPEKVEVAVHRSTVYASGEKTFEDAITSSDKARDKAKLTATQNIGAGAYVGASKVASGVLFIYPGFHHRYNKNSGVTAARGTNNNLFAAGVVGLPASAFSIFDTLRINVRGEITRHQQLKAGKHPNQLSAARLKQLDELESRLKSN
ncbi:MAG: hypothetical protein SGJ27_04630 [Candidatus Melainabacteria bacterium]|nr:hypothetical protein [Candidatus Melainabacteria bacterium]